MPESFSAERRRLMRFLGAKGVLTPASECSMGMVNKANELAERHGWFLTRQLDADMRSRTTVRDIIDDFRGERLDYWVTGYGTGGTLKGVGRCSRRNAAGILSAAASPVALAVPARISAPLLLCKPRRLTVP
jgi:cysteine synthase